jgi:hypothetical protein
MKNAWSTRIYPLVEKPENDMQRRGAYQYTTLSTWGIIFLIVLTLTIPLFLGYLQATNKGVALDLGVDGFETVLTIYSATTTFVGFLSGLVIFR